jgi:hypothetical protein
MGHGVTALKPHMEAEAVPPIAFVIRKVMAEGDAGIHLLHLPLNDAPLAVIAPLKSSATCTTSISARASLAAPVLPIHCLSERLSGS